MRGWVNGFEGWSGVEWVWLGVGRGGEWCGMWDVDGCGGLWILEISRWKPPGGLVMDVFPSEGNMEMEFSWMHYFSSMLGKDKGLLGLVTYICSYLLFFFLSPLSLSFLLLCILLSSSFVELFYIMCIMMVFLDL